MISAVSVLSPLTLCIKLQQILYLSPIFNIVMTLLTKYSVVMLQLEPVHEWYVINIVLLLKWSISLPVMSICDAHAEIL